MNENNRLIEINFKADSSGTLSRKHKAIQDKIKKIQKLKDQLDATKSKIKKIQDLYEEHISMDQKLFFESKVIFVEKLLERFSQKSFTVWQKNMLSTMIDDHLMELRISGYKSDRLDAVYTAFNELAAQNSNNLDVGDMFKDAAAEMMREMGFDIEDDFDLRDLDDDDFIRKQQQHFEEQNKDFEQEAKESQLKNKVENTDKGFYKLYKSLVKKAHPDLVTDMDEKEIREEWMKELSQAWADRNYLQLLILEQQITKNNSALELNDAQIKALIKSLNEEIADLDAQKYVMTTQDPSTSFYYQTFKGASDKTILKKIDKYRKEMLLEKAVLESDLERFRTQKSTKQFLTLLVEEFDEVDQWDSLDFFDK